MKGRNIIKTSPNNPQYEPEEYFYCHTVPKGAVHPVWLLFGVSGLGDVHRPF